MRGFQDQLRDQALKGPPCGDCGMWHAGWCPRPGPSMAAPPEDDTLALLNRIGPCLDEAMRCPDGWYLVRLRSQDLVVFCAAELVGEWIWLLGSRLTRERDGWDVGEPLLRLGLDPATGAELHDNVPHSACKTMSGHGFRSGLMVRISDIVWQTKWGSDEEVGDGEQSGDRPGAGVGAEADAGVDARGRGEAGEGEGSGEAYS